MANRNWRSGGGGGGGYQSFNQLLNPMPYYPPMNYSNERKNYGGRVPSYRDDNYNKRDRKDFPGGRRDRISPPTNRRRSPPNYQRPPPPSSSSTHDSHQTDFRRDSKKSHGRYEVKAPRLITFDHKELSICALKSRYPRLYIPSDFFHTYLRWQQAFPLYRPIKFGNHCEFQIVHKDVEIDDWCSDEAGLEPGDVDHSYQAKVMLVAMPGTADLYRAACNLSGGSSGSRGLNKNVQFLVGCKGKSEPMAIGGPWSPGMDGTDPEGDPSVLVNTAVRTCRALTGIDLSRCKKWYKILEIHYYRPIDRQGEASADKDDSAAANSESESRVEKVVIFLPDIWSCMPTDHEWTETKSKFEKKLSSLITVETPIPSLASAAVTTPMDESVVEETSEQKATEDSVKTEEGSATKVDEEEDDTAHNLAQMKVTELKSELSSRGLDTKGVKTQLIKRLQEALDKERGKTSTSAPEESAESGDLKKHAEPMEEDKPTPEQVQPAAQTQAAATPATENSKKPAEESKGLSEKERKRLEKLYKLSDKPAILCHPSRTAKAGKFECAVMTLENLLEYRLDDQKEHTFEVSLFAEQINEMFQRDAAFYIYKSLSELPDSTSNPGSQSADPSEPSLKKQRLDTPTVAVSVNEKQIRKSKMIADIHLLFSFCVFDCDNCGYLRDHDLEDIIHSIGLNFSRSQVRKLISKIPNKRGSLMYRDIVEKDVIEGSEEDIACLKDRKYVLDKLVELSKGNKAFFEENDNQDVVTRSGSLDLLDKLCAVENRKLDYDYQLAFIKDELVKIKSIHNDAGDVESNLKESIRKIQEKLQSERESFLKLSDVTRVYSTILRTATENMGQSIKTINDQFDHEKALIEEAKAREEAEKKLEMEAAAAQLAASQEQSQAQGETDENESAEATGNDDKKWQVVDQV